MTPSSERWVALGGVGLGIASFVPWYEDSSRFGDPERTNGWQEPDALLSQTATVAGVVLALSVVVLIGSRTPTRPAAWGSFLSWGSAAVLGLVALKFSLNTDDTTVGVYLALVAATTQLYGAYVTRLELQGSAPVPPVGESSLPPPAAQTQEPPVAPDPTTEVSPLPPLGEPSIAGSEADALPSADGPATREQTVAPEPTPTTTWEPPRVTEAQPPTASAGPSTPSEPAVTESTMPQPMPSLAGPWPETAHLLSGWLGPGVDLRAGVAAYRAAFAADAARMTRLVGELATLSDPRRPRDEVRAFLAGFAPHLTDRDARAVFVWLHESLSVGSGQR